MVKRWKINIHLLTRDVKGGQECVILDTESWEDLKEETKVNRVKSCWYLRKWDLRWLDLLTKNTLLVLEKQSTEYFRRWTNFNG